jgi:hypothetical protein
MTQAPAMLRQRSNVLLAHARQLRADAEAACIQAAELRTLAKAKAAYTSADARTAATRSQLTVCFADRFAWVFVPSVRNYLPPVPNVAGLTSDPTGGNLPDGYGKWEPGHFAEVCEPSSQGAHKKGRFVLESKWSA